MSIEYIQVLKKRTKKKTIIPDVALHIVRVKL